MKTVVIAWGNTAKEQALKAADALSLLCGRDRELWVFGTEIKEKEFRSLPYSRILILEGFGNLYTGPGQYEEEFTRLIQEREVKLAVFPDSAKGEELAVKVSLNLGTAASLKIICIREEGEDLIMEKRVYGGNLEGCFRAPKSAFAMTFDKGSMEESREKGMPCIVRRQVLAKGTQELICCEKEELPPCDSLEHADCLVVAGRGAIAGDTLEMLKKLGHELEAGLGATRPAVLETILPYSSMIGMSGAITKPKLCIVFGVSGSIAFMIGVRNSRILAAVNNNPDAAVFKACDLGVVDEAEEFAAAFLDVVRERKGQL